MTVQVCVPNRISMLLETIIAYLITITSFSTNPIAENLEHSALFVKEYIIHLSFVNAENIRI